MAWIEFSVLTIVILFVIVFALLLKKFLMLVVNSIIGFFALFAVKLVLDSLVIWPWATFITAIGGIVGLILVIVLHLLGVAFI